MRQVVVFGVLARLFGYGWRVAFSAVPVLAYLAAVVGWSWWNVLYALIFGAECKWLARRFSDIRARTLFEQLLIGAGMSRARAAQLWASEYRRR